MRRLGTVLHTTPNGYIIVEIENPESIPPLNVKVYDRDLRLIGVLLDIIGPVKAPYAVVKPSSKNTKIASGETVYYKPPRPSRPRKAGKGGKKRAPTSTRRSGVKRGKRGGAGGRGARRGERGRASK